ncbi:MAG: 30S ribosomal protein S18 [Candidatus Zambryskibacteria bacterium CG10_big_fil_rev_8_21_14_0_10_42_12]|uniref:Small ribosomal subunit protein bS18 n=1 Tax=Candidatus Zambryskibacteria bacterium CG10_big_fil_rev_8_21_14_0_10_42_12 TaxID=1975115 RepID=A0A2H0QX08_9BACT|nr:MAG: 30S ribosomal protein S18 [Candidatus Zambryskibacteria bacterium CG10_big_fil_rev_8_21_14_0_10_42_12]
MTQDYFKANQIKNIDYKDIEILKKFLNPHGRINSRKRTGLSATHQRMLAQAIKRARYMALLPFIIK